MAALATGLMRSLALTQATPAFQQRNVRSLVPAAVVLAKPHAFYTNLFCLSGRKFLSNAPALSRLGVRKTLCAAYGDMDGLSDADEKAKEAKQKEDEEAEKHLKGLKQDLILALSGTNWGMDANRETHAVIADIITQLEAVNPNPAPTEALEVLDGKWIMVYTSVKEFLPFVAARNLPLVNVSKISQFIDSDSLTVENVVSFTSPYMMTSFTNCASFDVRSPKRVQLKFEESVINTSQHEDFIHVPEQTSFMGHRISLKSLQDILQPFQDMAVQITKKAAEHKPLRIPYPANRVQSWLLTTYVDDSLRIARAECGGVFALVKEGSSIPFILI
ncbi:hypothetical protein KC19_3G154000 [Ceratodon purpureus]|uniref:Plastid lipid-associated protein/fibrillin conserved domain-containing protein n=1 Tax=Ceratodon purpureus TaxID=3225 RepID=A0A8T0ILA4_CERPU|nr:hypothetical protein KC19_3G154000 [Ceratodon purpureus]